MPKIIAKNVLANRLFIRKIMSIDIVKIPYGNLVKAIIPSCSTNDKFSCERYRYKLPTKFKGACDISRKERKIEIFDEKDNRFWVDFKTFFGTVVCDAKDILIEYTDGSTESMSIYSVDQIKIKRSIYLQLIFEKDLPF